MEVLAATTLVAFGLAGNYALFARTVQLHASGLHQQIAVRLALSTGDELRAAGLLQPDLDVLCDAGDTAACAALSQRATLLAAADADAARKLPGGRLSTAPATAGGVTLRLRWQAPLALRAAGYRLEVRP